MDRDAKNIMNMIEKIFENTLWSMRLFVFLPVIFSLVGAIVFFIVASVDVFHVVGVAFEAYFGHVHSDNFHQKIVSNIIGSIDLYLIAIVLLIFSFGLYELFISKIDRIGVDISEVLQIHSLDQLKDKLAKVIIMVLIVNFFQRVLCMTFDGALEMLYFALSIFVLSLGLYFLHKGSH